MKIFHINLSFTLGGLETMLVDILNEQCKYAEVHLLIVNDKVDENLLKGIDKSVKFHFLNRKESSLVPKFLFQLNYILFKHKPDVIHSHHFKVAPAIIRSYKFKMFLTVHDMRMSTKHYKLYDGLFAISQAVADDVLSRSGYSAKVIYNGIDFGKIKKKSNLDETNGKFTVVQISRLVHLKKGQHILLGALKKLRDEFGYNDIGVHYIGSGESLDYLKQLTAEYGLADSVKFLGNQDRSYIYDNLYKYSLLVQPSLYEGFGLTIVEGLAANIPVITSDVDGPKEIAKVLNQDFLFKHNSVDDLVKAIADIYTRLHKKPQALLDESIKLSEKAKDTFSIKNTSLNYLNSYQ